MKNFEKVTKSEVFRLRVDPDTAKQLKELARAAAAGNRSELIRRLILAAGNSNPTSQIEAGN